MERLGGPKNKELQRLGLTGEPVAFWGFANTDIYQCVPVDTLHQCFNGISLHLVEALKACIDKCCGYQKEVVCTMIRDRLSSYRRLHCGGRIPRSSIWAEKTCAEVSIGWITD